MVRIELQDNQGRRVVLDPLDPAWFDSDQAGGTLIGTTDPGGEPIRVRESPPEVHRRMQWASFYECRLQTLRN